MPRKSGKGQSAVSLVQVCRHNKITGCKTVKRTKRERAAKFRGDFFPLPAVENFTSAIAGRTHQFKERERELKSGTFFFQQPELSEPARLSHRFVYKRG